MSAVKRKIRVLSDSNYNTESSESKQSDDKLAEKKAQMQEIKEAERIARKAKALKSVGKLLDISETYAGMWKSRMEEFNLHGKMKFKNVEDNSFNTEFFKGELRPYQLEGVKWLKTLLMAGVNGILADEMGLGKTVQIIALLSDLLHQSIYGPHLIIVPLSTMPNWQAEFERFAPVFPLVVYHGPADHRLELFAQIKKIHHVRKGLPLRSVVLVPYHTAVKDVDLLSSIHWTIMVLDEAHKIKNHESQMAQTLRRFPTDYKILLTGTPLQNNLTELWALLNFIMPKIFKRMNAFSSLLLLEDMEDKNMLECAKENNNIVSKIHKVLGPFMLRRLKNDVLPDIVPKKEVRVYCPMSAMQDELYSYVIKRRFLNRNDMDNSDLMEPRAKRRCTINRKYDVYFQEKGLVEDSDEEEFDQYVQTQDVHNENDYKSKNKDSAEIFKILLKHKEARDDEGIIYKQNIKMANPIMMFRKTVCHPYLIFQPVYKETKTVVVDDMLISASGKMIVLDEMLRKLKERGHKVLIFSTLVIMLDLLEDLMGYRDYKFCRLDGSDMLDERREAIDRFNTDPDTFVFLISTRSGGVGLNLTAADTVIFYDRDWNPQVDIQAQDRCHRIGQTKPVMIYSLIMKNTVDEKILTNGDMKRRLEKLVIKDGQFKYNKKEDPRSEEYQDMIKFVNENKLTNVISPHGKAFSDEELERILDRSELLETMK